MIFTERPGRVRVVEKGALNPKPLFVVPDVEKSGESGLMSVALHPQFSSNHFLYLSYAYSSGGVRVRVVRYREAPEGLVDRTVIIENLPAAQFHAGCRIRFGPDGKLYVTTGDATRRELAQKLDSLAGKTLRLNDDGTVPQDNPFVGQQNAKPEIWSLGHRNAQGMDWQPGSNLMFQTENTDPAGLTDPEVETNSTSSRRARTTVGRPFTTRKRARAWSRRCLSTRRRVRRQVECFIAERRFRSSRETSFLGVCVARC
jgi:glucose/arabinose dehydrogenase